MKTISCISHLNVLQIYITTSPKNRGRWDTPRIHRVQGFNSVEGRVPASRLRRCPRHGDKQATKELAAINKDPVLLDFLWAQSFRDARIPPIALLLFLLLLGVAQAGGIFFFNWIITDSKELWNGFLTAPEHLASGLTSASQNRAYEFSCRRLSDAATTLPSGTGSNSDWGWGRGGWWCSEKHPDALVPLQGGGGMLTTSCHMGMPMWGQFTAVEMLCWPCSEKHNQDWYCIWSANKNTTSRNWGFGVAASMLHMLGFDAIYR